MSALAKKCRAEMLAKAKRLGGEKDQKTDSSNWSPEKPLNTEKKTGLQPLNDRMARKSGGRVEGEKAVVDAYVNRDVKTANAKAEGKPHEGGYKKGGRVKKDLGGIAEVLSPAYAAIRALQRGGKDDERDNANRMQGMAMANAMRKNGGKVGKKDDKRAKLSEKMKGMAKGDKVAKACGGATNGSSGSGGKRLTEGRRMNFPGQNGSTGPGGEGANDRVARASGGKVKGKTNISINILAGGKPAEGATPAMMPAPGLNPMPVPPPAPAPAAAAPPPALPIPNSPMPMGRKSGGRVYSSYKDMDAGACSGDGRLEKTEIQKKKRA